MGLRCSHGAAPCFPCSLHCPFRDGAIGSSPGWSWLCWLPSGSRGREHMYSCATASCLLVSLLALSLSQEIIRVWDNCPKRAKS